MLALVTLKAAAQRWVICQVLQPPLADNASLQMVAYREFARARQLAVQESHQQ
jgi:hypothetical protein